jgi:hypothetical protein
MLLFEDVLRKYVRMPWDSYSGKGLDVLNSVAFDSGGGEFFKEPPSEELRPVILHSIAIAVTIALRHSAGEALQQRNKWRLLSKQEQNLVLTALNLQPKHTSVLQLFFDSSLPARLASYIAAAYALTTYTKPYVVSFDRLAQYVFQSLAVDCYEMKAVRRAGLLIILGTGGGAMAGAEKVYSFLNELLSYRLSKGRQHVFIDSPDGDLLTAMLAGKIITREDVIKMYKSIFPPALRMHNFFFGYNVYIYPVEQLEVLTGERREATVI